MKYVMDCFWFKLKLNNLKTRTALLLIIITICWLLCIIQRLVVRRIVTGRRLWCLVRPVCLVLPSISLCWSPVSLGHVPFSTLAAVSAVVLATPNWCCCVTDVTGAITHTAWNHQLRSDFSFFDHTLPDDNVRSMTHVPETGAIYKLLKSCTDFSLVCHANLVPTRFWCQLENCLVPGHKLAFVWFNYVLILS